jgi:predicted nuclease with TOPRIM domain
MIDPGFDPYQELIDLRVELELIKANFQLLIHSHNKLNHENNRLRKWQQEQQQELLELGHKLAVLNERN